LNAHDKNTKYRRENNLHKVLSSKVIDVIQDKLKSGVQWSHHLAACVATCQVDATGLETIQSLKHGEWDYWLEQDANTNRPVNSRQVKLYNNNSVSYKG
jgi:hypothetical protein